MCSPPPIETAGHGTRCCRRQGPIVCPESGGEKRSRVNTFAASSTTGGWYGSTTTHGQTDGTSTAGGTEQAPTSCLLLAAASRSPTAACWCSELLAAATSRHEPSQAASACSLRSQSPVPSSRL